MATNTYVALQTANGTGSSGTITFTSISSAYTDLVLVATYTPSAGCILNCQVGNGSLDTGSNYSSTILGGTGSGSGYSYRYSTRTSAYVGPQNVSTSTTAPTTNIFHFSIIIYIFIKLFVKSCNIINSYIHNKIVKFKFSLTMVNMIYIT